MKKVLFGLWLILNSFVGTSVARAEYPISFMQMVNALLKEQTAQERKLSFYGKANEAIKKLIEEAIGTKGTTELHKSRVKKGPELEKARAFLNFEASITDDFIREQMKANESGKNLNFDDFIKFVEGYFFVKDETSKGKNILLNEINETKKRRQKFFDETLREAYVYSFINRGYSSVEGTDKEGIIKELKEQSDKDKTLREALYTNNRALQELIFETMQMIMFEQITLEIEAAEQLLGTGVPLLEYDYNKKESKEKK